MKAEEVHISSSADVSNPSSTSADFPEVATSDQPYPLLSKTHKVGLVITLASAGFLNTAIVQSTIITLPSISAAFQIPASRQQWVGSAYNVAMGCTLLVWGSLADVYGRRTVFLVGTATLTLVTIVPPFVQNEAPFYVMRALQGVFAAAVLPSALGILGSTLPPGPQRNYGITAHGTLSSLGSVFGNLIGGFIGGSLTWKWVFWILAIMTAFVWLSSLFLVPKNHFKPLQGPKKRTIDWFGAILVTSGILILLISLTQGNSLGWREPWVPPLIIASVLVLVAFYFWQRYLEGHTEVEPLIQMSALSNQHFSAGLGITALSLGSFQSFMYFATYFYQEYLGLGVIQTTLRFLPSGIAGLLSIFIMPKALSLFPWFYTLVLGATCGIISPLLFTVPIPPTTIYWAWGFPAMCLCVSIDIIGPALVLLVIQKLPEEYRSLGAGMVSTANQLGRTIGVVLATVVQTCVQAKFQSQSSQGDNVPGYSGLLSTEFLYGLRAAQGFNTGLAGVSIVLMLLYLRDLRY